MAKSSKSDAAKTPAGAVPDEKRYTSIKIGEKTLKRFDKNGAIYVHRATSTLFKREGDKLKCVSAKGITKKEYCKSARAKPV